MLWQDETVNLEVNLELVIPLTLRSDYNNFELIPTTSSCRVFDTETSDSKEKHRIRFIKEFVKKECGLSATPFVQDLQSRFPGSILANAFEISNDGQQLGCATLPYLPLSCQLDESREVFNPKDPHLIQNLRSDALHGIEFLWKNMQMRNPLRID